MAKRDLPKPDQNFLPSSKGKLRLLSLLYLPKARRWLLVIAIVGAWACLNNKLLLSTSLGILVMVLVYRMQEWDWQVFSREFYRFWAGWNRKFSLAVGCGGLATLTAYTTVSIWVDSQQPLIASGLILQNLGIFAVIGLLVWQMISQRTDRQQTQLEKCLTDLTDADPIKRLIAVRQITRSLNHYKLNKIDSIANQNFLPSSSKARMITPVKGSFVTQSQIVDCFHLMLSRESEPIIRNAVLDGLQVLDNLPKNFGENLG
ncbi:MAG: hypothetical protein QNJ68_16080 [Microcoleaceae cyanobacterium MO_207.B10]|nr:hypothetical protein [Microcoleaceae cyanobacterium MO_207.B10]